MNQSDLDQIKKMIVEAFLEVDQKREELERDKRIEKYEKEERMKSRYKQIGWDWQSYKRGK